MPGLVGRLLLKKQKVKRRLSPTRVNDLINRITPVPAVDLTGTYIIHALSELELQAYLREVFGVQEIRIIPIKEYARIKGIDISELSPFIERHLHAGIYRELSKQFGIDIMVTYKIVNNEPIYFINEPPFADRITTKKLYIYLRKAVTRYGEVANIKEFIDQTLKQLYGFEYNDVRHVPEVRSAVYYFVRDTFGYGPLSPFLADEYIEDISWYYDKWDVKVADQIIGNIFPVDMDFIHSNMAIPASILAELEPSAEALDERQRRIILRNLREQYMRESIQSILYRCGVGLTYARPIVETKLYDPDRECYHRVAAHLDNVSRSVGITIRKFPAIKRSIVDLVIGNTLTSFEAAYFIVTLINRGFVLIVGDMGSGKTTFLQALISALPEGLKVITIEDTPELSTPATNWHPLYTRRVHGYTEIEDVDEDRLLRTALRHRGRVVTLGEVRGKEMATLIQAAASGHAAVCLPPDYPVYIVKYGQIVPVMIKDVVEMVKRGEKVEVVSLEPTGVLVSKPVKDAVEMETTEYLDIYLADGRRIRVTPDHEFVLYNTFEPKVVRADQLKPGDKIPVVKAISKRYDFIAEKAYGIKLTYGAGYLFGKYLLTGEREEDLVIDKWSSINTLVRNSIITWLDEHSIEYEVAIDTLRIKNYREYADKITRAILEAPLSLPYAFVEGMASAIMGRTAKIKDWSLAHTLPVVFATNNLDSIVEKKKTHYSLKVIGRSHTPVELVPVKKIEHIKLDEPEKVYDIVIEEEKEFKKTFLTLNLTTCKNCTFHSKDPFTVLMRIITKPIEQSEESLKLITSIASMRRDRAYITGEDGRTIIRKVRRVGAVYEIPDNIEIIKSRAGQEQLKVFEWINWGDIHRPRVLYWNPVTKRVKVDQKELIEFIMKARHFIKQIGAKYPGEELRIVADVIALAAKIEELAQKRISEIQTVNRILTQYMFEKYISVSDAIWEKIEKILRKNNITMETLGA